MASVTVRNLDDEVVRDLKEQAKRNHRSLEAELRRILTDQAHRKRRREELVARAERIAAMAPKGVPQTDSVDLIREDRDR